MVDQIWTDITLGGGSTLAYLISLYGLYHANQRMFCGEDKQNTGGTKVKNRSRRSINTYILLLLMIFLTLIVYYFMVKSKNFDNNDVFNYIFIGIGVGLFITAVFTLVLHITLNREKNPLATSTPSQSQTSPDGH
jgi:hypothetical protein